MGISQKTVSAYTDKTLLRVAVAFWLSEVFDFPWTPKMEFVDLFINNEYIGNYQLGENVKVSRKRVNISKETGYLIEVDQYYDKEPNYFISEEYKCGYSFKHPDGEKITGEQRTAILNWINNFESVLKSDNFKDENSGYRKYIDVESFCKWFLFHEVLANLDTNTYCCINDLLSDKLKLGPVWDFEWSLGIGWYDGPRPRDVNYWAQKDQYLYFKRLLEDEYFVNQLKNIWNNKKNYIKDNIFSFIDEKADEIEQSRILNFKRWNILNERISVGGIPLGSYESELTYDKEFLKKRIEWLDKEIEKL